LGTQDIERRQTKEKAQHRKPKRRATRTPPKTGDDHRRPEMGKQLLSIHKTPDMPLI